MGVKKRVGASPFGAFVLGSTLVRVGSFSSVFPGLAAFAAPAALAAADSKLAGNDAYGRTADAADLSGDRRPVRIALQRLDDLRAFRLGNHAAIKAWGELDDKLAALRHR